MLSQTRDTSASRWIVGAARVVALIAGAVVFLPFALNTSPLDGVTLRVPGNQGNWWHVLVGAPFFLAFPLIWLRFRPLILAQPSSAKGRRIIWAVVGLSIGGTIAVEVPFLLHLAGTSERQRFLILGLGLGALLISLVLLLARRRAILSTHACIVGLNVAYVANASLCLIVYSDVAGGFQSRSGWFVTMGIVWPMLLEVAWIFVQSYRTPSSLRQPAA